MDTLPIELVVMIACGDPIAFARLIKADRRVYMYVLTPYGKTRFLAVCAEQRIVYKNVKTYSLITGSIHSFYDAAAVIRVDGSQHWYKNNQRHRDIGPAIIHANENMTNFLYTGNNCTGDIACALAKGDQTWWQYGQLHRDDGPAVVFTSGQYMWYQRGCLHRVNGPAVVRANGKYEWWINGRQQISTSSSIFSPCTYPSWT